MPFSLVIVCELIPLCDVNADVPSRHVMSYTFYWHHNVLESEWVDVYC